MEDDLKWFFFFSQNLSNHPSEATRPVEKDVFPFLKKNGMCTEYLQVLEITGLMLQKYESMKKKKRRRQENSSFFPVTVSYLTREAVMLSFWRQFR
jgi:hypothetical protein